MKRPLQIPPDTLRKQATASDPRNSVWVSANAGSGKTHVLAQRVVRLLLGGADPSRILCLTYTRAAAANMSNRVFETLSAWAMLPDAELARKIEELEGDRPRTEKLARARKLFTRALETPGGLKVQTIHAFCESVLHQFPLEANIAAHFAMLDPRMEEALFAEARRDMITGAASHGRPELTEAFATVLERAGEFGLDQLLKEIVNRRDGLRRFVDAVRFGTRSSDRPFEPLFEEFGFAGHETAETVAASIWPLPDFPPSLLSAIDRACLAVGAARARDSLVAPAALAFADPEPVSRLAKLQAAFLSAKGEPYKPGWLFGKKLLAAMPDLPERYAAAAAAIMRATDALARYRMVEGTQAALIVADWLIARYEQLKAGRGFLDFNDLISRTVRLLARQDAGPWVQYKLDKGIDHILLDEAQDTSPDQWNVVRYLAAEFFAGYGARENVERTIFAVGDEKQSIYSFQGASPESFAVSGMEFKSAVEGAGRNFESVNLKLSFRSTNDVLRAVDRIFADPDARRGLSQFDDPIEHEAIRAGAPGYVELWPSIGAADDHGTGRLARGGRPRHRACRPAGGARGRHHRPLAEGARHRRRHGQTHHAGRHHDPGAQARPLCARALARPEEPRHRGRRRRPAASAQPYRHPGSDCAWPLSHPARGRPVARGRVEKSDLRAQRRGALRARGGARRTAIASCVAARTALAATTS